MECVQIESKKGFLFCQSKFEISIHCVWYKRTCLPNLLALAPVIAEIDAFEQTASLIYTFLDSAACCITLHKVSLL